MTAREVWVSELNNEPIAAFVGDKQEVRELVADRYKQIVRYVPEEAWIPVTERLPELGQKVLFWFGSWQPTATPGIGTFGLDAHDSECWVDETQPEENDVGRKYYSGVTHWRPLPQPPKVSNG